jgi:hypothetical protein
LKNKEELVEVYKAHNQMEAQVIKGLLESFDIPCVFKANAAPSVHVFTMDGMGEVNVMVLKSMAEKAKELILKEPPSEPGTDTPE